MDDRTFDERTARQWIHGIEHGTNRIREQDIYPRLRGWIERAAPERVLEIGCGQGICADKINLRGGHYTGIDASRFMVKRAEELYGSNDREFLCANAYELPFPERQFDAVFSVMVWHLLSEIQKAALEMSRVLKPAGQFLIITANPGAYREWENLYINAKSEGRRFEGDLQVGGKTFDHDVLYFHSEGEIVNSLISAGFEVGAIEPFRKGRQEGREYLISIQGALRGL
jgi:SAM-dependent methyltransferase